MLDPFLFMTHAFVGLPLLVRLVGSLLSMFAFKSIGIWHPFTACIIPPSSYLAQPHQFHSHFQLSRCSLDRLSVASHCWLFGWRRSSCEWFRWGIAAYRSPQRRPSHTANASFIWIIPGVSLRSQPPFRSFPLRCWATTKYPSHSSYCSFRNILLSVFRMRRLSCCPWEVLAGDALDLLFSSVFVFLFLCCFFFSIGRECKDFFCGALLRELWRSLCFVLSSFSYTAFTYTALVMVRKDVLCVWLCSVCSFHLTSDCHCLILVFLFAFYYFSFSLNWNVFAADRSFGDLLFSWQLMGLVKGMGLHPYPKSLPSSTLNLAEIYGGATAQGFH